jgi:hypothetical protein
LVFYSSVWYGFLDEIKGEEEGMKNNSQLAHGKVGRQDLSGKGLILNAESG